MTSKFSKFFRKYFLEGQKLDEKQKEAIDTLSDDAPLTTKILVKHRRLIGIFRIKKGITRILKIS